VQNHRRDPLSLTGASNFRSLGGLPAAGGRRLRPYALMRADRLAGLDDTDWDALAQAGLATICDLRSDEERAEHPNRPPAALGVVEMCFDIRNDLRADPALAQLLLSNPTARGAELVMVEIYSRLPRYLGSTLATIAGRLLDEGAPLLVHCSAGKDRTGFVIGMLLHALDVPEPLIREDYLASRRWPGAETHRASLEERLGRFIAPCELDAAVSAVLDVREEYLDSALVALHAEYGSIPRYLEIAAGLGPERVERLRERLLV
jgi:protein-tyrosine phosphatase